MEDNNLYFYAISKFIPTDGFSWIDPKEFDLKTYIKNSLKRCVLEVNDDDDDDGDDDDELFLWYGWPTKVV